jgi:nitrite reductase (NADH) small subunit
MTWTRAFSGELADGKPVIVRVAGLELALARVGQAIYALDNICPHAGGSIGDGYIVRGVIHCSWHDWPFELATGAGPEGECVKTYPAREKDGWVEVEI